MKKPDYAPLPWRINNHLGTVMIESSDEGIQIADTSGEASVEAMRYAVHCVNTYDALLRACERLVLAFDVGDMAHTTINGRGYAALEDARAAIKTAREGLR